MKKTGFTIIELMITIAVLSFGVIGIYSAFYAVVAKTSTASNRLAAAYLAQEGLEIVRNIRDNNVVAARANARVGWAQGLLACETGCQTDYISGTLTAYDPTETLHVDQQGLYSYGQGQPTDLRRKITIHSVAADILEVTVQVFFDDQGKQSSFSTQAYLYNYQ